MWAMGAAQTLGRDIVLGPLSPNGVLLEKPLRGPMKLHSTGCVG